VALVLTKLDRLSKRDLLLPVITRWNEAYGVPFAFVVPTSALTREGLDELTREIVHFLPAGPRLYDDDQLSDRAMRWHAGERVRAALFAHLDQELPYSCAVTIESFKEREAPPRDIIHATIHVERESQKKIVIGRKGQTIRKISMGARQDIARFTDRRCDLFTTVKVTRNWTKDAVLMKKLGYHEAVGAES
jgi:GTP-binding protein Era